MNETLEVVEDWSLRVQIDDVSDGKGTEYRCSLYDPDVNNELLGEGWGTNPRLAFNEATQRLDWKQQ
jgi:hypothetical protein